MLQEITILASIYLFLEKLQYLFMEKKLCYDLVLICDSLPFYAHAHTCSPSYTDEE